MTVKNIKIDDRKYIQAIGSEDIDIVFNRKEWVWKYFRNVFHIPELSFNVFSTDTVLDKLYDYTLTIKYSDSWRIYKNFILEEKLWLLVIYIYIIFKFETKIYS